jgi:beta-lactamase regulating signal transducer with metallopeptidase domain/lipopolysaccharide export system protein LptA
MMFKDLSWLLFSQCWQVALLALVVWLIVRTIARNRPHLAHVLWVLVLLKCVTPPVFSSPASPFSWLAANESSRQSHADLSDGTSVENVMATPPGGLEPIVVHMNPMSTAPDLAARKSLSPLVVDRESHSATAANKSEAWPFLETCLKAVVWVWLIGGLLSLGISIFRLTSFLQKIRRHQDNENPRISALVEDLRQRLKIKRKVKIQLIREPIGPAVVGLWQPALLLPSTLVADQPDETLEVLLAHELIHIRRGDLYWAFLQTLASSMFWFHPLVRLASRQVTRESERSCDEETVASLGCKPATYARTLLNILEHKQLLRVAPALPGVRPVDITSARLERVMKLGNGCHQRTPTWVWLTLLALAAVALPGAAMAWTQDPQPQRPTVQQEPKKPADGDKPLVTNTKMIVIQARMLSLPPNLLSSLDIGWSVSESKSSNNLDVVKTTSNEGLEHYEIQPKQKGSLLEQPEWKATFAESNSQVASVTFVEKSSPVLYATADSKKLQNIMELTKQNASIHLQQAPTITVVDGQQGIVKDIVSRPFVVGFDEIEGVKQGLPAIARQPVVRVIDDGTSLQLKAKTADNGSVDLVCDLAISKIRKVNTFKFAVAKPGGEAGEKEQVQLQIPEVAVTGVRSLNQIPAGESLFLCCQRENDQDETECLVVTLTCTVVDAEDLVEHPTGQTYTLPNTVQALPPALDPTNPTGNFQALPVTSHATPPAIAQSPPLAIRSARKIDSPRSYEKAQAILQTDVVFEGDVGVEMRGTTMVISGDELEISNQEPHYTSLFRIRAEKGELQFDTERKEPRFHFTGNAKLDFEGATIAADSIRFDLDESNNENFLSLEGNASLIFEEGRLKADKIEIDREGNRIITGSGELILSVEGMPTSVHNGEFIVWDTKSNKLTIDGNAIELPPNRSQVLPAAYYLSDDIQYFPQGPEFKLSAEAKALKEARAKENESEWKKQ